MSVLRPGPSSVCVSLLSSVPIHPVLPMVEKSFKSCNMFLKNCKFFRMCCQPNSAVWMLNVVNTHSSENSYVIFLHFGHWGICAKKGSFQTIVRLSVVSLSFSHSLSFNFGLAVQLLFLTSSPSWLPNLLHHPRARVPELQSRKSTPNSHRPTETFSIWAF